jgi:pimeloyl-ACP methyl ester carboxylesterase
MSAITIGGDLIHYEVLGRGRPVLLLHDWLGSWRYWIPAMQQLLLKYRVYSLDFYGFGDSSKNPQKYTLDYQVQLLVDFMNHMAIPKAAFIGHGLGALVASEFARLYPDKAPRLLLISPPLFDPGNLDKRIPAGRSVPLTNNKPQPARPENDMTVASSNSLLRAAELERARARTGDIVETPLLRELPKTEVEAPKKHNPLTPLLTGAPLKNILEKCFKTSEPEFDKLSVDLVKADPAAIRESVTDFDSGRMLDRVRLLTMPVLIMHGVDDPLLPSPGEDIWNYVTAEKSETIMPLPLTGVRHFPMLEYERFNRVVTDFLDIPDISQLEIKERWKRRTR